MIAYLVVLALAQVTPPDLTISPDELYHKYKAGLVRPVPFAAWVVDPTTGVKKMLEGAAWFLPLGLLLARVPRWRRRPEGRLGGAGRRGGGRGRGRVHAAVRGRAFLRRHGRGDERRWRCWPAGTSVPGRAGRKASACSRRRRWVVALAYLNWYPFDFHLERDMGRWRTISWLPFADYLRRPTWTAQGAADKVIQFFVLGALPAQSRLSIGGGGAGRPSRRRECWRYLRGRTTLSPDAIRQLHGRAGRDV